jgi:excisionase family DNA binding protein|tara:strand:+ start:7809 stop:8039 length:231 start_codon:yes stop_codon:yes gene_type:complete
MSDIESPYVNINTVVDYFQVSLSTIRKWVYTGQIPASSYIKVGDIYRFRLDEVEAALTSKTSKAHKEALKTKPEGE